MLERQPVESDNLASVGYDPNLQELEIEFRPRNGRKTGPVYRYYFVPAEVYTALMQAGSKGQYHRAYIMGVYSYEKIAD